MHEQQFNAQEIADAMRLSKRGIELRATRDGWSYTEQPIRGGRRRLYRFDDLPSDVQQALLIRYRDRFAPAGAGADASAPAATPTSGTAEADAFSYDRESLWAHYERRSERQKQAAQRKLELLDQVMAQVERGFGMTEALQAVGRASGTSWRTIQGWYHGTPGKRGVKHFARTDWLAALVPGYQGRTARAEIPAEAWETFKADYLRLEQPSAAECYRRLQQRAAVEGWQLPALRTFERRIQTDIPHTVRVLLREGEQALLRLYPAQERDVSHLHALEWINGDGYQHNVFVRWPDGSIARPKTWFWADVYSRKLLAWRTDLTEHTDVLRLSFGDLVEQYGIPDHVTIDNTRAAANKWMTGGTPNRYRFKVREDDPLGIFTLLGIKVHWTSVHAGAGHGQAKPIERHFGIGGIGEVVDKHPAFAGAWTGNRPDAKPENYASTAIPLDEFLRVLDQAVAAYNARPGRRTQICGGVHSFDEAFAASYANAPIRKATAEQRRLWLLAAEAIRVAPDGSVTLDAGAATGLGRNRYHSEALYQHIGRKVVVRFDPQQLHGSVHVYSLDGRYLGPAECIQAAGFGDAQAGREWNRARKEKLRAAKRLAAAEKRMSIIEVADKLPDVVPPAPPTSRVVRPLFPVQKQVAGSDVVVDAPTEAERYGFADTISQAWEQWRRDKL